MKADQVLLALGRASPPNSAPEVLCCWENIAQCGLDCDWVGGAVRVVGTSLRPGDWGSRSGIENGAEAWGHSICVQGGARSAGGG